MASRIRRLLTSRRLAVGLLATMAAWSAVAMSVPQASLDAAAASAWTASHPTLSAVARLLGLDSAFSSPLFGLALGILLVSTLTCAWERTRISLRGWRSAGTLSPGGLKRLQRNPELVVTIAPGTTVEQALSSAEDVARTLRLRVRRGPTLLEGSAGRVGLLGSPVFHWSLALLIAVIVAGRLTRAEGMVGVPVGERVLDAASSYRSLDAGPLYPGHSGLGITVDEVQESYSPDGLNLGVAVEVALWDGEREVARQLVYANHPLRYGTLMVHASDWGLAPSFSLEDSRGIETARSSALVDFLPGDSVRTDVSGFDITDSSGESRFGVDVSVPLDAEEPSVEITVTDLVTSDVPGAATLGVGEAFELPDGEKLRLAAVPRYGRLSVADDWSVVPIYALFAFATVGLSLAILTPHRRVRILAVEAEGRVSLHVVVQHDRGSAVFREEALDAFGRVGANGGRIRPSGGVTQSDERRNQPKG
ncbi:MAG: cytochrome c biogenesis protein ResB [Actinomycetota bacterium]|nr:cytochrome c biogenesis protein ResB [Actinomycetota bacterium]